MSNGSNEKNIQSRVLKVHGKVTDIINILEKVTFGSHYFKVAKMLRESIFLNGIMTNSEIWYGVSTKQVEQLETVDKLLLRKFLNTPVSTPGEGIMLEFGVLSIGTIMKARRVNFLQNLLKTSEKEMLSKFFKAQHSDPVKNDWTVQVLQDLKDLKIELSMEQMQQKSIESFKNYVKKKAIEYEFSKLMGLKQHHTKMDKLSYTKLEMQPYLKVNNISSIGGQTVFRYRTHMANYRQNYGNNGPNNCPLCGLHLDNQYMAFYNCQVVKDNIRIEGKYEDLFKPTVPNDLVRTLTRIEEFRKDKI